MIINVAGNFLEVPDAEKWPVIGQMPSLRVFEVAGGVSAAAGGVSVTVPAAEVAMRLELGCEVAPDKGARLLYEFETEGIRSFFERRSDGGYGFRMVEGGDGECRRGERDGERLRSTARRTFSAAGNSRELIAMRKAQGSPLVKATAVSNLTAFRFSLWMAVNMALVERGVVASLPSARSAVPVVHPAVAVHSSVVVRDGRAVLFLGESGTGKSTHTRLWLDNLDGSWLLNDDSPFIAVEHGQAVVYGSPWSGKTPCYHSDRVLIAGIVRLSQAPHNRIRRLSPVEAFGALYPSLPPAFAYDEYLTDRVCALASDVLERVPVYHLECLPDRAAAELSCRTVLGI